MDKTIVVRARCILTPVKAIVPGALIIQGGKIVAIGPTNEISTPVGAKVIDALDKLVVPGFIDTHVHGRAGHSFGKDRMTSIQLCEDIARTGVTGILPTLTAQPDIEDILEAIRVVLQIMREHINGAEILGIHLEGPYLSTADTARGSQPVEYLRKPSLKEFHRMAETSQGTIRKMGIAPELEGALDLIREMVKLRIIPCVVHSAATYEQTMAAVEAGLKCASHTFNGMPPFHHRKPGVLGAVLTCDKINAELIADGQHVSHVAMQLLMRCKGVNGIHLVTDNTMWAGLPNGTYKDLDRNRTIVKEDQRVYVLGGTLAGSVAPMNFNVANLARATNCSLAEAVQMASLNPATVIGVADRKGSLEPGKDADLLIIDEEVNIYLTMVKGREVYRADL